MTLPPKSAREGLLTALAVAAVVYLLLRYALGASAGEAVRVVVLFTVLSFLLDLVRGRYRRSAPRGASARADLRTLWAEHLAEPLAAAADAWDGWAAWDSAVAGHVSAAISAPLDATRRGQLRDLATEGRAQVPSLPTAQRAQVERLLTMAELALRA